MSRAPLVAALLAASVSCAFSASSSWSTGQAPATTTSASPSAASARSAAPVQMAMVAQADAPVASVVPAVEPKKAVLVQNNPVAAAALAPALIPHQQKLLPGSRPTPEALGGVLLQGQTLQGAVNLQPERCYSVLGLSPSVHVFTLELRIGDSAPLAARPAGGLAVLGLGAECIRVNEAKSAQLRLSADTGAGPVVAQLYER